MGLSLHNDRKKRLGERNKKGESEKKKYFFSQGLVIKLKRFAVNWLNPRGLAQTAWVMRGEKDRHKQTHKWVRGQHHYPTYTSHIYENRHRHRHNTQNTPDPFGPWWCRAAKQEKKGNKLVWYSMPSCFHSCNMFLFLFFSFFLLFTFCSVKPFKS